MIDELWELVMDDDMGIIAQIRLNARFDNEKFARAMDLLEEIINDLKDAEVVPRKLFLIVIELIQYTALENKHMSNADIMKLEDANDKIHETVAVLYRKGEWLYNE